MSPALVLVLLTGAGFMAVMITAVHKVNARDRANNAIGWAAYLASQEGYSPEPVGTDQVALAGGADRAHAIGATGTQAAAPSPAPVPAPAVPGLGTRIRLDDGRFGTVDALEPVPGATRVHLDMDDGSRGHVDSPTARVPLSPRPALATRPAPAPVPVRPVAPRVAPVPAPVPPAPAPAATPAAPSSTVRLGGFSLPVAPVERGRA